MSQQSRSHKQGRYVEYANQPGQVLYGEDDGPIQPLLTDFVVGKDVDDPYSTIGSAVLDAGAIADADNWKWVFVKPGRYVEGTIELPPYVALTGNATAFDWWLPSNIVLEGGFTVSTDGPRIIRDISIERPIGDLDLCLLVDVPTECRVSLQNCNLLSWEGGVVSAVSGGAIQTAQLYFTNCYVASWAWPTPSPDPTVTVGNGASMGFTACLVGAGSNDPSERALLITSDSVSSYALGQGSDFRGITENAGSGAYNALYFTGGRASASQGPALILSNAAAKAIIIVPPMLQGTGAWDIDGIGTIVGAGAIFKTGANRLLINPTVTVIDGGAFLPYVPTVAGDWPVLLGGVPTDVLNALDIIANRLALLGG